MVKENFTTRLDPEIKQLAKLLANDERRSVTALIEVLVQNHARASGYDRNILDGKVVWEKK